MRTPPVKVISVNIVSYKIKKHILHALFLQGIANNFTAAAFFNVVVVVVVIVFATACGCDCDGRLKPFLAKWKMSALGCSLRNNSCTRTRDYINLNSQIHI